MFSSPVAQMASSSLTWADFSQNYLICRHDFIIIVKRVLSIDLLERYFKVLDLH